MQGKEFLSFLLFAFFCIGLKKFSILEAAGSEQLRERPSQLSYYEGNFTDSDGDGMTDLAEIKYGFNPNDPNSYPMIDFIADPVEEFDVNGSAFNNAKLSQTDRGIRIFWDNNQSTGDYNRYSLTLEDGDSQLYYGGHGFDVAEVPYGEFGLDGNEILRGRFSESNIETGEWVADHEWFEIDLSHYPLPPEDNDLASENDKISFAFSGFSPELKEKYLDFMKKVIPIIKDVIGNPAESFVCEFKIDNESSNSWVTLDQGRSISMDDTWIPRLLVHEMIHMWKGKYAFSYSGENWSYSDDLNGFEEVAEGLAYEILHDFVEAFPYDENTRLILDGGVWWNWSSAAANFDVIKHQKHTGGGTFWSGEALFSSDRYGLSAMVIQTILRHDPEFMKRTLRVFYDKIEEDSSYRPTRASLLDLWTSQISEINGIDSRSFLEAMPIFNGEKLKQGYYPVIFQHDVNSYGTTKTILGSYAVDGNLWWGWITPENIADYNIPHWVNYNLDADGFYYVDSNNQAYKVVIQNIFGEEQLIFEDVLDAGYQNEEQTVPNNLFVERIEELDSANFGQGLYLENLTFTNIEEFSEEATETFYSFGYKDFTQSEYEYSLFIGVDSRFAEDLSVTFREKTFDVQIINGCAIIKTSEIPHNADGMLSITVNSFEHSNVYKRALNNAGSADGLRHQQFLIIDRDFDGIEDLYDSDISQSEIEIEYQRYKSLHSGHRDDSHFYKVEVSAGEGGTVELFGFSNGESVKAGTEISVRAVAEDGYEFEEWEGGIESNQSEVTFTVENEMNISVRFVQSSNSSILDREGIDLGNGWRHLSWFGYFSITSTEWLYHLNHGWIFPVSTNLNSIWYWDTALGWCWTKESIYPFIYQKDNGWLYFETKSVSPNRLFFRHSDNSWISR